MPSDPSENVNYPVPARRGVGGSTHLPMYAREGGPATGGSLENWVSPKFLLWVFAQWWMFVIPAGAILAAIAASVVWYSYVPSFQATALMTIEESAPYVAFSGNRDSRGYIRTQLELINSPIVLEPVLRRPEIAALPELVGVEDQVRHLQRRLSVRQIARSQLFNFSYTSPSPQAAADVVNAIIAEFLAIQDRDENRRTQQVIDLLEQEQAQWQQQVQVQRNAVVELAKDITGRNPFGSQEVLNYDRVLSPVGTLFQGIIRTDLELALVRANLKSLETPPSVDNLESTGLLDLQVENHTDIRARQVALQALEAHMEQIKNSAIQYEINPRWETNPAYIELQEQWNLGQEDLKTQKAKVREALITKSKEAKKGEREQQIAALNRELELLQVQSRLLGDKYQQEVDQLQSGDAKSVQMEFARSEYERANRVYELIASRKLALQTEQRAPARIQLQQPAVPPRLPVETVPYKQLLLVCAVAFASPMGLAVLREITVRRISDVEQLAQHSGLRVLGEVVALPVRLVAVSPNQLSKRLRRATYIYAESINSLRTNLALSDGLSRQVLAVTSAATGEGKTSVAVSLAMSIANASEQPTLVVDGDMRSPFAATMLRAKSQPGLFDVLTKVCTLEEAIQPVGENGLYLLPGGRATQSTHRVLGTSDIIQLLEQLRGRFSTIVIDTPPILGASEALILAKAADAVLFCSLCGVSKAAQVRLAIERLHHARANIAGAVLSGTSAKHYEYVYGYYTNGIEANDLSGVASHLVK
jgi:capsular exopolysaccharide synthesis family protein